MLKNVQPRLLLDLGTQPRRIPSTIPTYTKPLIGPRRNKLPILPLMARRRKILWGIPDHGFFDRPHLNMQAVVSLLKNQNSVTENDVAYADTVWLEPNATIVCLPG